MSLDRLEQLAHLVCFRFSLVVLHVHAWVARPGHLPHAVTRPMLSRLAEEVVGDLARVREADIDWVRPHVGDQVVYRDSHVADGAISGTTLQRRASSSEWDSGIPGRGSASTPPNRQRAGWHGPDSGRDGAFTC